MVKMIDRSTGVEMWVADSRVAEYLMAGHKLATEPAIEKKPTETPKKRTRKTTTKK